MISKEEIAAKIVLDGYGKSEKYHYTLDGEIFTDTNSAHAHASIHKLYAVNENGGQSVFVGCVVADELPSEDEAKEIISNPGNAQKPTEQLTESGQIEKSDDELSDEKFDARVKELMEQGKTETEAWDIAFEESEKEKESSQP